MANWYAYIMRKILNLRKLSLVAFFVVWLTWIVVVGFQVKKNLSGKVEERAANLIVAINESTELPIYSKFYVTQSVSFPEPIILNRVNVPIRQPDGYKSTLLVSIQTDTLENQENNFEISANTHDLIIPLNFSKPAKNMTIMISAVDVSWKVKDTAAPRVYREKSRSGYRDGQMTIAGINKEGNIALSVYATYTKTNFMHKQFNENHKIISLWFKELLLVFLVIVWPVIFLDVFFVKKQQK